MNRILVSNWPFPLPRDLVSILSVEEAGKVYEITNLNDSGRGSIRAVVNASRRRTVVFRISGIIDLKSALIINNPYITIVGLTT